MPGTIGPRSEGNIEPTRDRAGRDLLLRDRLAFIKVHPAALATSFAYKAWLDERGGPALIQRELLAWVKVHGTIRGAQFVYKAWLDGRGEPALIKEDLLAWLQAHPLAAEAQFVFKAWLDAKGAPALIKGELLAWLQTHATAAEAHFVYKAWLDANGERALIRKQLVAWLAAHPQTDGVDYVCTAWLQAGGEYSLVQRWVEAWLHEHRDDAQAVYLLKEVSKQRQLADPVLRNVLYWCQHHADHPDAIWRLSRLGRLLLRSGLAAEVLAATQAVVKAQAVCVKPSASGVEGVLLLVLGAPALQGPEQRWQVLDCYRTWLLHRRAFGGPTDARRFIERAEWVGGLRDLLLQGGLQVDRDQGAIRRLVGWVRGFIPQNRQVIAGLLTELAGRFPSEVWGLGQDDHSVHKAVIAPRMLATVGIKKCA